MAKGGSRCSTFPRCLGRHCSAMAAADRKEAEEKADEVGVAPAGQFAEESSDGMPQGSATRTAAIARDCARRFVSTLSPDPLCCSGGHDATLMSTGKGDDDVVVECRRQKEEEDNDNKDHLHGALPEEKMPLAGECAGDMDVEEELCDLVAAAATEALLGEDGAAPPRSEATTTARTTASSPRGSLPPASSQAGGSCDDDRDDGAPLPPRLVASPPALQRQGGGGGGRPSWKFRVGQSVFCSKLGEQWLLGAVTRLEPSLGIRLEAGRSGGGGGDEEGRLVAVEAQEGQLASKAWGVVVSVPDTASPSLEACLCKPLTHLECKRVASHKVFATETRVAASAGVLSDAEVYAFRRAEFDYRTHKNVASNSQATLERSLTRYAEAKLRLLAKIRPPFPRGGLVALFAQAAREGVIAKANAEQREALLAMQLDEERRARFDAERDLKVLIAAAACAGERVRKRRSDGDGDDGEGEDRARRGAPRPRRCAAGDP